MKVLFYSLVLLFISYDISAQINDPFPRFIEVTGSAEMSIPPDEVELQITLNADSKISKKGEEETKLKMDVIEKKFFNILAENNIPKENIKFNNTGFAWYYYWSYRRSGVSQKSYLVKLDMKTDFMKLMQDLDIDGVQSLSISSSSNKQIQEFRQEVKIQAVKAAKEKATYLLNSIDEELGKVISIIELEQNNYYWRNSNALSNVVVSSGANSQDGMNEISEIKLRYEVKAKFEIQ